MAIAFARLRKGGTPESVAAVGVHELVGIEGVEVAMVVTFPSGPGIVRLAAGGTFMGRDPWLLTDGCGEYLRRRIEVGRTLEDWSQHRAAHEQMSCTWGQTGLQAVQLEPVVVDGAVVGGIVVGSMVPNGRARLLELAPLLAEYGSMIAALLGPEVTKRRRDRRCEGDYRGSSRRRGVPHRLPAGVRYRLPQGRRLRGTDPFRRRHSPGPAIRARQRGRAWARARGSDARGGDDGEHVATGGLLAESQREPTAHPGARRCWPTLLAHRGDRRIVLEVTEHAWSTTTRRCGRRCSDYRQWGSDRRR